MRIDELWLDHDLDGADQVWPSVRLLEDAHLVGEPFEIGMAHVQASGAGQSHRIGISMRRLGYGTKRLYDLRMWVRWSP